MELQWAPHPYRHQPTKVNGARRARIVTKAATAAVLPPAEDPFSLTNNTRPLRRST